MRKIILEEWISLDGYVSDRNGKLDFFTSLVREAYADIQRIKFIDTIDTILFGRTTFQQFSNTWPFRPTDGDVLAAKINGANKIVCSNTLENAPWGNWPHAKIIAGDSVSSIKQLKSTQGKNIILWGSISLAQALMKENLIDEYHLHLCPTLTSGDRRFFTKQIDPATLELLEVRPYGSGAVFLRYNAAIVN